MVEDILKCFPNSKVALDPFMGSGTTAIACINMNKSYIGFELVEEHYKLAKDRINQYIIDKNLQDTYSLIA